LLNAKYDRSLSLLLSVLYPEYEWLPWKFVRSPVNFWSDSHNKKKFLDWAGKQLGVKEFSDWYKVSTAVANLAVASYLRMFKDIKKLGGKPLLEIPLSRLLTSVYPEHNWELYKFVSQNWNEILQGNTSEGPVFIV
jgi:hypothetical protein